MQRYVSPNGSNSADGRTRSTAWQTLTYASSQAVPGMTVNLAVGDYAPADWTASGAANQWVTIRQDPTVTGESRVVGDGFARCLHLAGVSHIAVRGLTFSNNGGAPVGWSAAEGLVIRDLNNTPGIGRESHHITVEYCTFKEFVRAEGVGRFALPLGIIGYGDEEAGESGCHHVVVRHCTFHQGLINIETRELGLSSISVNGNVYDVLIENNDFFHDMSVYGESHGCVEFASNYSVALGANPDRQRRLVVSDNRFITTSEESVSSYAIYIQACADTLVERNIIFRRGYGIAVLAEEGDSPYTSERVWVRDNLIVEPAFYGIVAGTWADTYRSPDDISITSNIVYMTAASGFGAIQLPDRNTTDSPEGLLGTCRFVNNIVRAPEMTLKCEVDDLSPGTFERNVYISDAAEQTYWETGLSPWPYDVAQDTSSTRWPLSRVSYAEGLEGCKRLAARLRKQLARKIDHDEQPSWYVRGSFGDYEPTKRLDVLGRPRSDR